MDREDGEMDMSEKSKMRKRGVKVATKVKCPVFLADEPAII